MIAKNISKFCKKLVSIIMVMALLINCNVYLFAQSADNLGIAGDMWDLRELVEDELRQHSEEELIAMETEAMGILQKKREELIESYKEEGGGDNLREQVDMMVKLLYPFYGDSAESISQGYPDSQYFKEPGSLYKYLYERAILISTGDDRGGVLGALGLNDLRGIADIELRNVFIFGSKDKEAQAREEVEHGNAISNAFIMLAYGHSLLGTGAKEYYSAVHFVEDWCKGLKESAEEEGNEFDYNACVEQELKEHPADYQAYRALAELGYDDSVAERRHLELRAYGKLASERAGLCVNKVLRVLQAGQYDLAFGDIRDYIEAKSGLLWESACGISEREGKELVLAGVMSYEEADRAARNVQSPENFWDRVFLDSWKYITPSHYVKRADAISTLKEKYPSQTEGLSGDEINRAAIRSAYLENSLNQNLVRIASNYILYGLIFQYGGFGEWDSGEFGKQIYTVAMGNNGEAFGRWARLPIAQLCRDAIHQNRGAFNSYAHTRYAEGKALWEFEQQVKYVEGLYDAVEFFYIAEDILITWLGFSVLSETGVVERALSGIWGLVNSTRMGEGVTIAGNAINRVGRGVAGWMGEALGFPRYGRSVAINTRLLGATVTEARVAQEIQAGGRSAATVERVLQGERIIDPASELRLLDIEPALRTSNIVAPEFINTENINIILESLPTSTISTIPGLPVMGVTGQAVQALDKIRTKSVQSSGQELESVSVPRIEKRLENK